MWACQQKPAEVYHKAKPTYSVGCSIIVRQIYKLWLEEGGVQPPALATSVLAWLTQVSKLSALECWQTRDNIADMQQECRCAYRSRFEFNARLTAICAILQYLGAIHMTCYWGAHINLLTAVCLVLGSRLRPFKVIGYRLGA